MKNRYKVFLIVLFLVVLVKIFHFSWVRSSSSTLVFSQTSNVGQSSSGLGHFNEPYHLVFHGLEAADKGKETGFAIDVTIDRTKSVHSITIPFFKRMKIESLVNYKWIHPLGEMGEEESVFFQIRVKHRVLGPYSEKETEQHVMTILNKGIRDKINADIKAVLNP